jgi:hypothetical protein
MRAKGGFQAVHVNEVNLRTAVSPHGLSTAERAVNVDAIGSRPTVSPISASGQELT